jgi:hypothetical protein
LFGPLPVLYRVVLVAAALVIWIGLGVWSGARPDVPVTVAAGLLLGVVAGLVSAYVLLHDFDRRPSMSTDRGRRRIH